MLEHIVPAAALIGALAGFWQGAFKQVANMVGVAAGVVLALLFHQEAAAWVGLVTGTEGATANTLAFVAIVVLVPIALGIVASLLTQLFKAVRLNFLNRLAGALIGALCYGLLAWFALYILETFSLNL